MTRFEPRIIVVRLTILPTVWQGWHWPFSIFGRLQKKEKIVIALTIFKKGSKFCKINPQILPRLLNFCQLLTTLDFFIHFSSFHDAKPNKATKLTINYKSINVVPGTQTHPDRMEGALLIFSFKQKKILPCSGSNLG